MSDIEDLLARFKGVQSDVEGEHSEPSAHDVAPQSVPPVPNPAVEAGKAALAEVVARTTSPAGPATIDSTVTQGNRVVPASALTPNDPLKVLTDRVRDHWYNLQPVMGDLRVILAELETLSNKIGVGL